MDLLTSLAAITNDEEGQAIFEMTILRSKFRNDH